MTVEKIKHILKTEYGIKNDEEFKAAVEDFPGINIGIFTMPLLERSGNSEQKTETEDEAESKNSCSMLCSNLPLSQCAGA